MAGEHVGAPADMGATRAGGRRRRAGEGDGGSGVVAIVGDRFCRGSEERRLTVRKTSLFYRGDGFAVYGHRGGGRGEKREEYDKEHEEAGELVFRVDTYGPDPHGRMAMMGMRDPTDELVLMGPDGECILTVRRKWPSLHQRWEGFLGEKVEGQRALFSVRRSSIIGRSGGIGVEVYQHHGGGGGGRPLEYRVEGSFPQRCCTVYEVDGEHEGGEVGDDREVERGGGHKAAVAEIRRKVVAADASPNGSSGVVLGRDVFCLRISPGFDAAFAMGLVLVLDQITGGDREDGEDWDLPHVASGLEGRDDDGGPH